MVVTRFAPSPTGFLHVGHIRTALYSYALARKYKGKFILRIEDTDKKREVTGAVESIIKTLKVFNISFDEGPIVGGPNEPYIQSQRLDVYRAKANELIDKNVAYYCFCDHEKLEDMRETQRSKGDQPMYDGRCKNLRGGEVQEKLKKGEPYVIRLKVPEGRTIRIEDKILGKISWDSDTVDDQILIKSDGYPTYHLAVVVDDVLMGITHITRGFEWLSSVPKHVLLFEAFKYKIPVMAHLPLILNPQGGKLSKRKGSVSAEEFLMQGYLPEAILNFIMLLGWAPKDDREFYSLKEFVKEFSLDRLNKSNPVFNREKLIWFNGEYIRRQSTKLFSQKVLSWIKTYHSKDEIGSEIIKDKKLSEKLELIQERAKLLSEVLDSLAFFYKIQPIPDLKDIKGVKRYPEEEYRKVLIEYYATIRKYSDNTSDWKHKKWETDMRALADVYNWKHGDMFMLIRIMMCGSPYSPPLFESMQILGKREVLNRLDQYT